MKNITDEIIEYQKMKINSNAIKIVIISLIVDIVYKSFMLKESFYKFSDITLILLVLLIYVLIEYTRQGIFIINNNGKNKKILIGSIFSAILFGILIYFLNKNYSYIRAIVSSIMFFIMYFLNKISENRFKY